MIGNQSLTETCLVTPAHEALEMTDVAELDISAILHIAPVASGRSAHRDSGCHVPPERIAVLGLDVYRICSVEPFGIAHIGSQAEVMHAVSAQIAPVEGLQLS